MSTYGVKLTGATLSTFVPAEHVHALTQAAPLTALPIDDSSVYAALVDGHVLPVIVLSSDETAGAMLVCNAEGERFVLTGFSRAEFCEQSEVAEVARLDLVSLVENLKRNAWRTGVYPSVAPKEKEPSYG